MRLKNPLGAACHNGATEGGFLLHGRTNRDPKIHLGDVVRINLTSEDMPHDGVVDEFNASMAKARPGNTVTLEFVADKNGTFEHHSNIPTHRTREIMGQLIVE
jgi:uncharacterized cupredoxin-like copper-binding protein